MLETELYAVTAYRYANKKQHSYLVGIFDSYKLAKKNAKAIGKYICQIKEVKINLEVKDTDFEEWIK